MLKMLAFKFTTTGLTSFVTLALVCATECGGGSGPQMCDHAVGQNITVCQETCSGGAFRPLYPQSDGNGGYKVIYKCGCAISCA